MKAAYLIWPDIPYIERLIAAGVDTLIVASLDSPNDPTPAKFWGAWEDVEVILRVYHDDPRVHVIYAPVMTRYWERLPKLWQYESADGLQWPMTPCPTSLRFFSSRSYVFEDVLWRFPKASLAIDFEDYAKPSIFKEDLECFCGRCHSLTSAQKQEALARNLRMLVVDHGTVGVFPYGDTRFLNQFDRGSVRFFDESTYDGVKFKHKWKAFWRRVLTGTKTVAGIWCERMTPDEIVQQVEKLNKSWVFEGYWLYAHARFSPTAWVRKRPYLDDRIDPYHLNLIDNDDPEFFNKLSRVNGRS